MVSVIVPVYNTKVEFLRECVDSLLTQTFGDFEIIIVDDGSDNADTLEHLSKLNKPNINIIHTENCGVAHARNVGIQNAKGQYLTFVDSDDWVEPDYLEVLEAGIADHDLSSVGTDRMNTAEPGAKPVEIDSKVIWTAIFSHTVAGGVWNKLFKKKLIKEPFDESIYFAEDFLFVANYCKNVKSAVYIPRILYHYRQHPDNASSNNSYNKRRVTQLNAFSQIKKIYEEYSPKNAAKMQIYLLTTALNLKSRYLMSEANDPEALAEIDKAINENKSIIKKMPKFSQRLKFNLQRAFPKTMFKLNSRFSKRFWNL